MLMLCRFRRMIQTQAETALDECRHSLGGHCHAHRLAAAGIEGPVHTEIDAADLVLLDRFLEREGLLPKRPGAPVLSVVIP